MPYICTHCGKKIKSIEENVVCPYCGSKILIKERPNVPRAVSTD
ncbi:MAG: DNA-directed RNA polymerase subunit P [Nitrososphaeria archaeon]